ncbi:chloramphenicol phosphotransferase-like protein [Paramyrothecium foliicola]|nr:chloramphenicol phosphotransferase-like protein [Paramyrothecium foliicola]
MSGKIIVLNGFPGTGKFTILKQIKKLLPDNTTCLLDNHLLIDPVVAVICERRKEHHELRRLVRAPIFRKLRERAREGHIIFLTACLADNDTDASFLEEHVDLVRGTDACLFWVNTYCNLSALEERVRSPDRCDGSRTKVTDPNFLQELVRNHHLIKPEKTDEESTNIVVRDIDVSGSLEASVTELMTITGLRKEDLSSYPKPASAQRKK